MAVELEWRIDGEVPEQAPSEEASSRRPRGHVWLSLLGALLLLAGVACYAWWHRRQGDLAKVEAEVQAVAQLELRALAERDTELYLSLQDHAYPAWIEVQQALAARDALLPPPLPGLNATAALSVENPRVVGDVARVEVVRMAGLPGGETAPFRAVRFYRRSEDGRWLHTRADPTYAGPIAIQRGQRAEITSFAADKGWIEPVASELERLAERFCSFAGIIYDRYDRARFTTTVVGIDGMFLLEANVRSIWSPDGQYLAVAGMDRLRVLEIESGTWYSFELPALCGGAIWNPRGPLHEPAPHGGHVVPP